jgi:excisionase family DNA binding protein
MNKKQLSVRYEKGATSDVAVFDPSEVRRLKAELQTRSALVPTVVRENPEGEARKPESTALTLRPSAPAPLLLPPSELTSKLLLTLAEAALLTGLGKGTLNRARREGKLIAVHIGGSYRFRPADLRAFIKSL